MTTDTHSKDSRSRWGRIPAWWLDHPELDADGLAVLAALATYADDQGVCWPSQATLAAKLKRSRPTVNRILGRLGEMGLVAIERRSAKDGARLSCRYRLRLSPDGTESGVEAASKASVEEGRAQHVQEHARKEAVQPANRPDSETDSPCSPASHEQPQPEQIPDSLCRREQGQADAVPEGWTPAAGDLRWGREQFPHIDLDRHVEGFVLRCRAHGYRYRDVGAAWRAWLIQDAARKPASAKEPGVAAAPARQTREAPAEQRVAAWAAVAARLQAAADPLHFRS
ncbi:helix-turn-helix domain-containing protein [Azospirillum sp. SYSU D00513]|uniref:helix-turn-helix domain-containing protein n=1 Tax=Azospirillum sp. SYSU D00513 TaxID=2812561 RepID=UPI001A976A88|nr:helix-turn-helix domain-containing protein [Azospirillum sp. SYSU D00513]